MNNALQQNWQGWLLWHMLFAKWWWWWHGWGHRGGAAMLLLLSSLLRLYHRIVAVAVSMPPLSFAIIAGVWQRMEHIRHRWAFRPVECSVTGNCLHFAYSACNNRVHNPHNFRWSNDLLSSAHRENYPNICEMYYYYYYIWWYFSLFLLIVAVVDVIVVLSS